MVTTEEMRLRSKQPILSTSTTSSSPQVLLATSQPRIQDNRNNRDRDARNENKTEICRNFGRGYCRWGTNCRFIHASPKGTNNPRPNSSQHNTRSMQQGPGHTGLNSASQQHLLSLIQAQQNLLAQYGLSISQGQQPVQHNNTMGLRPNAPPGFQQTQPHQPTFGFNGHQQALYSAAVQNQSASSGSTSQETQLPHAFNTLTLQDPANSNWNMDTGASSHLNSSVNNLSTIFNSRIYPSVLVGDGKSIPVTNTGHSTLPTPYRTLHLNNVLITPNIVKNLISVRQFVRENKCTIEFDEFGFSVKDFWTRQILLRCDSTGDLYPVTSPSYPQAFLVGQQTWHQRLGHPGSEVLRSLVSNNLISCNKTQSSVLCHACQLGKHVRLPFSLSETIVKAPFDIIHSDLWTSPLTSVSGIKYYVLFLDHFSHYLWVYPLRHKSDVLSKFIHFRAYVKNHFNCDIKSLQCDHGGEFDNTALHQLFVTNGISIRFSCPKTSQQNGKSERMIRTINNMIRTLLFQAHLPPTFWVEALHMAAYLLNILPSTAINNEIPHTRLFKTTPNYADLRVFGCLCYPHLHTNHKLEPRATPAIFLGYPTNHRGYRCLDLNTNKIILSRHVTFDETVFPYGSMTPHDSPSYTFLDTSPNIIHQHIISKLTSASPLPTTTITSTAAPPSPPRSPLQPAHQTHESSPLPHSPNVQPTSNASTETTIPTHNHNNPTSTHPMVTRFRVGTNRPTQRFNLHVSTISPIPKSYPIAFRDPNWYRAMLDEYTALIKNNTWILVPRPPDANIVRSMWLFRHKYNADGTLSRYKARLVANGSTQLAGIDVDETFSPVVKPATIRTVLSLAISRHWPVHQLDVKNAFLHGSLSETVYMHQPPGFRDPQHPDHVCLLQRSLYGLKQAPRAWFQRFAAYAARVGFHHSRCDSSLFIYRQGADTAYLLLYVDDIVLTASSSDLLQQIITSLHAEFSMTDLGSLNYFLGISVTRNASGMFLSQQKYATEVLDRAGMLNCKPCRTPVDTDSKLSADGAPISDSTLYRSLAGALQYLTFTRPDISYAVQQVCLFMHDPREPHLSALKRILRYVRGTLSYGLQLYSSTTSSLVAYSDADWAGCPTTRRSTSGYCVFLGNNLLSWSSKRQFTLSRSSAEAEYRGVANAVAETCWLRNLLRELHTPLATATLVYCDNVSAVYLSSNPVQHQRTKHIEIDIHFVRDLVATGAIRVLHVPSRYQYADIFTKGLPTSLFDEFRTSLSVRSSPAPTAGGFPFKYNAKRPLIKILYQALSLDRKQALRLHCKKNVSKRRILQDVFQPVKDVSTCPFLYVMLAGSGPRHTKKRVLANPYDQLYYYSGFGLHWGKRRKRCIYVKCLKEEGRGGGTKLKFDDDDDDYNDKKGKTGITGKKRSGKAMKDHSLRDALRNLSKGTTTVAIMVQFKARLKPSPLPFARPNPLQLFVTCYLKQKVMMFLKSLHGSTTPPAAFFSQQSVLDLTGTSTTQKNYSRSYSRNQWSLCLLVVISSYISLECALADANLAQAFTSQCHVTQGHPDWYVDSGATAHMTSSPDNVSHSAPHSGNMRVFFGNGDALPVSHIGQSMVSNKILLRDVLSFLN
ncbi:ribonuclease H-like domain-containing protein [Tanacetum coccineum]